MSGKALYILPRISHRIILIIKGQYGLGLAETLVAVAILATAVAAFIAALSTASITVSAQEEATVSQRLALSQLEYTKSQNYNPGATSYPAIDVPEDYALAIAVYPVPGTDTNIQKLTVTVSRDGRDIITISDYKVNR
jgi:Tfp pilus assembly protein PilV